MVPSIGFDRTGNGVRISRLIVDRVPKGAKVVAKCSGCGSQTVQARRRPARSRSPSSWARASARAGTIEIRVTLGSQRTGTYKFGATGSYFKWPVQANGLGKRQTRCIAAGTASKLETVQVRTFAVALFAALAFAAPAQAQLVPPPTVLDFEALQPAGLRLRR